MSYKEHYVNIYTGKETIECNEYLSGTPGGIVDHSSHEIRLYPYRHFTVDPLLHYTF